MLAAMLAGIAANDRVVETTRRVGGVNFQCCAKVLPATESKRGSQAVNKQLQLIFSCKQNLNESQRGGNAFTINQTSGWDYNTIMYVE